MASEDWSIRSDPTPPRALLEGLADLLRGLVRIEVVAPTGDLALGIDFDHGRTLHHDPPRRSGRPPALNVPSLSTRSGAVLSPTDPGRDPVWDQIREDAVGYRFATISHVVVGGVSPDHRTCRRRRRGRRIPGPCTSSNLQPGLPIHPVPVPVPIPRGVRGAGGCRHRAAPRRRPWLALREDFPGLAEGRGRGVVERKDHLWRHELVRFSDQPDCRSHTVNPTACRANPMGPSVTLTSTTPWPSTCRAERCIFSMAASRAEYMASVYW